MIGYEYKIIIIIHTNIYIHLQIGPLLGCVTPKYRIPFFPFNHRASIEQNPQQLHFSDLFHKRDNLGNVYKS